MRNTLFMLIPISNGNYISPLKWADLNNIVRCCNHPSIAANTSSIPYPYTHDDAAFFLKLWLDKEEFDIADTAMAIRNSNSELIGAIGMHTHRLAAEHVREIGYWLGFEYRNQGITTDAALVYSDWILDKTDISRIEGYVYSFNPASKRVLEKAGFEEEGFLRKFHKKDGKLIDAYLLAKIK